MIERKRERPNENGTRQNANGYMISHVWNGKRHANSLNYMRLTGVLSSPR